MCISPNKVKTFRSYYHATNETSGYRNDIGEDIERWQMTNPNISVVSLNVVSKVVVLVIYNEG